jgi:hypothetical protein
VDRHPITTQTTGVLDKGARRFSRYHYLAHGRGRPLNHVNQHTPPRCLCPTDGPRERRRSVTTTSPKCAAVDPPSRWTFTHGFRWVTITLHCQGTTGHHHTVPRLACTAGPYSFIFTATATATADTANSHLASYSTQGTMEHVSGYSLAQGGRATTQPFSQAQPEVTHTQCHSRSHTPPQLHQQVEHGSRQQTQPQGGPPGQHGSPYPTDNHPAVLPDSWPFVTQSYVAASSPRPPPEPYVSPQIASLTVPSHIAAQSPPPVSHARTYSANTSPVPDSHPLDHTSLAQAQVILFRPTIWHYLGPRSFYSTICTDPSTLHHAVHHAYGLCSTRTIIFSTYELCPISVSPICDAFLTRAAVFLNAEPCGLSTNVPSSCYQSPLPLPPGSSQLPPARISPDTRPEPTIPHLAASAAAS